MRTLAFSQDGKWLVSCGDDYKVIVWDDLAKATSTRKPMELPQKGKHTSPFGGEAEDATFFPPYLVALSPDGKKMALTAYLYSNTSHMKPAGAYEGQAFTTVYGVADRAAKGKLSRAMFGKHGEPPLQQFGWHEIGFTEENELFETTPTRLSIYDFNQQNDELRAPTKPRVRKEFLDAGITSFFPNDKSAVTCVFLDNNKKWQLTLWRFIGNELNEVMKLPDQPVTGKQRQSFLFAADGSRLAIVTVRQQVEVWDLRPYTKTVSPR